MACRLGHACGYIACLGLWLASTDALAQAPSGAAFPEDPPPPAAAPPAAAPPPVAPAPTPVPTPTPAPPPATPPAAAPAPAPTAPAPVPQPYAEPSYAEPPPPPPQRPEEEGAKIPPFSVRMDPFNWILLGQLGFQLEVGVLKWLSVETVPMFVVDKSPPSLHIGGSYGDVQQASGGWGALSGATLGLNFWPRKVFDGYVIRTGLTNYSLEYETKTENGVRVDWVPHVQRQFYVMLGSVSRWGAFTIGGDLGLGYELNKETRCFPSGGTVDDAKPGNCDEIQIATPSNNSNNLGTIAVTPFTYPWEILGRISLGVTID